jgi:AraC family L-rhamnose operon regulatory protein RhaS
MNQSCGQRPWEYLYKNAKFLYLSAMKRYRQFNPVMISDFEASQWQHPVHSHNHYELIYIKMGSGSHHINKETVPYEAGAVFFLGPEEEHYFEIEQATRFIYLKFTDSYLHQEDSADRYWVQQLEYLTKNKEARLTNFRLNTADQQTVDLLFEVIVSLKDATGKNERLIWLQVLALAALLKRNLPEIEPNLLHNRNMQAIFCYIHEHIYTPDKLKAAVMAGHFNTSADYIGPYFKRNTGVTLREYIRNYRKRLMLKRIDSGNYTLKQIAAEFSLTDESHVSKLIR